MILRKAEPLQWSLSAEDSHLIYRVALKKRLEFERPKIRYVLIKCSILITYVGERGKLIFPKDLEKILKIRGMTENQR